MSFCPVNIPTFWGNFCFTFPDIIGFSKRMIHFYKRPTKTWFFSLFSLKKKKPTYQCFQQKIRRIFTECTCYHMPTMQEEKIYTTLTVSAYMTLAPPPATIVQIRPLGFKMVNLREALV